MVETPVETETALRQLIALTGIPVPEDEIPELVVALEGVRERVENLYSVDIGDTPPTAMLRIGS